MSAGGASKSGSDETAKVPDRAGVVPGGGSFLADRQTARATVRIGRHFRARAEVNLSAGGVLSIAALVGGILLTTSVLVATTIRTSR